MKHIQPWSFRANPDHEHPTITSEIDQRIDERRSTNVRTSEETFHSKPFRLFPVNGGW